MGLSALDWLRGPKTELLEPADRPSVSARMGWLTHHEDSPDGHESGPDLCSYRRLGKAPGGDHLEALSIRSALSHELGALLEHLDPVLETQARDRVAQAPLRRRALSTKTPRAAAHRTLIASPGTPPPEPRSAKLAGSRPSAASAASAKPSEWAM